MLPRRSSPSNSPHTCNERSVSLSTAPPSVPPADAILCTQCRCFCAHHQVHRYQGNGSMPARQSLLSIPILVRSVVLNCPGEKALSFCRFTRELSIYPAICHFTSHPSNPSAVIDSLLTVITAAKELRTFAEEPRSRIIPRIHLAYLELELLSMPIHPPFLLLLHLSLAVYSFSSRIARWGPFALRLDLDGETYAIGRERERAAWFDSPRLRAQAQIKSCSCERRKWDRRQARG